MCRTKIETQPLRIKLIRHLLHAAYWLARPVLGKTKFGQHYEIIMDLRSTMINTNARCRKMDGGTLFIYGFPVMEQRTEEQTAIDQAIENLEQGEMK